MFSSLFNSRLMSNTKAGLCVHTSAIVWFISRILLSADSDRGQYQGSSDNMEYGRPSAGAFMCPPANATHFCVHTHMRSAHGIAV